MLVLPTEAEMQQEKLNRLFTDEKSEFLFIS